MSSFRFFVPSLALPRRPFLMYCLLTVFLSATLSESATHFFLQPSTLPGTSLLSPPSPVPPAPPVFTPSHFASSSSSSSATSPASPSTSSLPPFDPLDPSSEFYASLRHGVVLLLLILAALPLAHFLLFPSATPPSSPLHNSPTPTFALYPPSATKDRSRVSTFPSTTTSPPSTPRTHPLFSPPSAASTPASSMSAFVAYPSRGFHPSRFRHASLPLDLSHPATHTARSMPSSPATLASTLPLTPTPTTLMDAYVHALMTRSNPPEDDSPPWDTLSTPSASTMSLPTPPSISPSSSFLTTASSSASTLSAYASASASSSTSPAPTFSIFAMPTTARGAFLSRLGPWSPPSSLLHKLPKRGVSKHGKKKLKTRPLFCWSPRPDWWLCSGYLTAQVYDPFHLFRPRPLTLTSFLILVSTTLCLIYPPLLWLTFTFQELFKSNLLAWVHTMSSACLLIGLPLAYLNGESPGYEVPYKETMYILLCFYALLGVVAMVLPSDIDYLFHAVGLGVTLYLVCPNLPHFSLFQACRPWIQALLHCGRVPDLPLSVSSTRSNTHPNELLPTPLRERRRSSFHPLRTSTQIRTVSLRHLLSLWSTSPLCVSHVLWTGFSLLGTAASFCIPFYPHILLRTLSVLHFLLLQLYGWYHHLFSAQHRAHSMDTLVLQLVLTLLFFRSFPYILSIFFFPMTLPTSGYTFLVHTFFAILLRVQYLRRIYHHLPKSSTSTLPAVTATSTTSLSSSSSSFSSSTSASSSQFFHFPTSITPTPSVFAPIHSSNENISQEVAAK